MLDHAFATFSEVWFHISPVNIRSQRATKKLGAEYMGDAVLDLTGQPTEWMCFRLSKEAWARRVAIMRVNLVSQTVPPADKKGVYLLRFDRCQDCRSAIRLAHVTD
jgi:hypothetical protein